MSYAGNTQNDINNTIKNLKPFFNIIFLYNVFSNMKMPKTLSAKYSQKKQNKIKKASKASSWKLYQDLSKEEEEKQQYGHKHCKRLWEDEKKRLIVYRESIIKHEKIKMLTNKDLLDFC